MILKNIVKIVQFFFVKSLQFEGEAGGSRPIWKKFKFRIFFLKASLSNSFSVKPARQNLTKYNYFGAKVQNLTTSEFWDLVIALQRAGSREQGDQSLFTSLMELALDCMT